MPLYVQVQGWEQMQARLQPGRLLQPTKGFIADLAKTGQRTAQRAAKPHPQDKGTLGRAIFIEIKDKGNTAIVAPAKNIAGIAFTIEHGRKPGRRPPYSPIKKWAESHGIVPPGKGSSKQIQALREDIKARGTKGIKFIEQAQKVTDSALKSGIPRTENEIRDIWNRP